MSWLVLVLLLPAASADYWSDRADFVQSEADLALGSAIVLNDKELAVNDIIRTYKSTEYDTGFNDPQDFLPSVHFFHAKDRIEQSDVFKFIQKVPKGASLHSHDTAIASFEFTYNLTYSEKLYGCVVNERLKMKFFDGNVGPECDWRLLKDLRAEDENFDAFLQSQLTIVVDNPITTYPNINVVWAIFLDTFATVSGMVTYRPIFKAYFYQGLKELYEDNVMYIEFRGIIPTVYELNGTTYTPEETVKIYIETVEEFKRDYPNFHGARLIYAPSRAVDNKTADEYVALVKRLKNLYPDFIAGFDLVGEEDKGKPLRDFVPQLLDLSSSGVKLIFHAAETDWNGVTTDLNLIDAVLLNTTRIGHGYGIVKHPKVLEMVKERQIAMEISPVSNQVLKLVDDLRNHPGAFLIASGYPVVITCDDPGYWGAKGLSYDWYEAFMGLASREGDLRMLKQLALNSLNFSLMPAAEKKEALAKWETRWEEFLDDILINARHKYYYDFYSVNNIR